MTGSEEKKKPAFKHLFIQTQKMSDLNSVTTQEKEKPAINNIMYFSSAEGSEDDID
jgi:hypothetical protein